MTESGNFYGLRFAKGSGQSTAPKAPKGGEDRSIGRMGSEKRIVKTENTRGASSHFNGSFKEGSFKL